MTSIDANSVTGFVATLDPMRALALITGALIALGALYLLLHYTTRRGRARAREAARVWADVKRVEWNARAEARAERARERGSAESRKTRGEQRALIAGAGAVVLVAVAATNLSAHGIQARLDEVGLDAADARVSVFLVFEGLLALAGGLSFWHQVTGRAGVDRYAVGMWIVSLVMAYLAAWGGGALIYAAFPIIAAVAWHELVTAEAKRRGKYRGILGRGATAEDTDALDAQRRVTRLETCSVRANTGARALRWLWRRLYDRAFAAAAARGLLTPEVLDELRMRVAARYAGARALAPEAVEDANPWARRVARATEVEAAPVERALETPSVPAPRAHRLHLVEDIVDEADVDALIAEHCKGGAEVRAWVRDFWADNRKWPTGAQLAERFGGDPGNCRKWVSDLKKATGNRAAA